MNYDSLDRKQQLQEDEYQFPYKYLDLLPQYAYSYRTEASCRVLIRELISPFHGQELLDAGCGAGRLCYDISKENVKLTGIDYSERAICFARAFCPGVRFIVADLTQHCPEEKFDVIVLEEVLEHIEPTKIPPLLFHLRSCLAERGKLIITVPSERVPVSKKHYQHFTVDGLRAILCQYFQTVYVRGHLRIANFKYYMYRLLTMGDHFVGPLRPKLGVVRPYYWLVERLLASIERCPPEKAATLVAVCIKASVHG